MVAQQTGSLVLIDGHASATGPEAANLALSAARARAAAEYLERAATPVPRSRIRLLFHGSAQPWAPSVGTGEVARNRRVQVRIREAEPVMQRTPLEPPAYEEESGPTLRAADVVPGAVLKVKIPLFSLTAVPTSTVILYPALEFNGKAEIVTSLPAQGVVTWEKGKGWSGALKLKLADGLDVEATGTSVTASLKGVALTPEVKVDLGELIKPPFKVVTIAFSVPMLKTEPFDLGSFIPELAGMKVKLEGTVKLKVAVGPGPAVLEAMAPAAAADLAASGIVAGAVVGGVLYTGLSMYLIDRAHKAGEQWAATVNRRSGYAWRIAAEAADLGRPAVDTPVWNRAKGRLRRFRTAGDQAYADGYVGWTLAESALRTTESGLRHELLQAMRDANNGNLDAIQRAVFLQIGGISHDETPPPTDLRFLRRH
jgi:hypothetical protein